MAKVKAAKKLWYPVIAPKLFNNVVLGETLVYEPEKMVGKCMKQNLMNLTNDIKRQNINVNFEIVNVENGKANTNIVGYNMLNSSVKRFVRRNIEKIDMSFLTLTADKKNVRLKPLLITRLETSNSIAAKMRRYAQDFLTKYMLTVSYDAFTNDLISHKLQESLRAHLNKIYPLKICEIRDMYLVKEHSAEEKEAKRKEARQERKAEENRAKRAEEVVETKQV